MGLGSRRIMPGVLAVAALLMSSSPAAAGTSDDRCSRKGSRTIQATEAARVYLEKGRFFGCLNRTGKRVLLGADGRRCRDFCSGVTSVLLTGRFVAVVRITSSRSSIATSVALADLRTRRSRELWFSGSPEAQTYARVESLTANSAGTVAWISSAETPGAGGQAKTFEVHLSTGGSDRVLESGTAIEPDSLALGGRHLFWFSNGQVQTAPVS
jgi:hypothetical protein